MLRGMFNIALVIVTLLMFSGSLLAQKKAKPTVKGEEVQINHKYNKVTTNQAGFAKQKSKKEQLDVKFKETTPSRGFSTQSTAPPRKKVVKQLTIDEKIEVLKQSIHKMNASNHPEKLKYIEEMRKQIEELELQRK